MKTTSVKVSSKAARKIDKFSKFMLTYFIRTQNFSLFFRFFVCLKDFCFAVIFLNNQPKFVKRFPYWWIVSGKTVWKSNLNSCPLMDPEVKGQIRHRHMMTAPFSYTLSIFSTSPFLLPYFYIIICLLLFYHLNCLTVNKKTYSQ